MQRDRERDDLTQSEEESVLQAMREILEDFGERRDVVAQAEEAIHAEERSNAAPPIPLRVLACPARDQADRLVLEMLRQLLDPATWVVEIAAVETLTADLERRWPSRHRRRAASALCRREGWPTHATCARNCELGI